MQKTAVFLGIPFLALLGAMAAAAPAVAADKYTYVGGGRYTCRGTGCGEHDARQAAHDDAQVREREQRELERTKREREDRMRVGAR